MCQEGIKIWMCILADVSWIHLYRYFSVSNPSQTDTLEQSTDHELGSWSNVRLLLTFLNAFSRLLYLSHGGQFAHWHQPVGGTLVALLWQPLTCYFLPDIPHFCWSPLFWTDRHTGLSFRVKSLHNSLKCFLILVFWYLSPTLCLEHAASSLYLEFSGLTGPKPQTEPWVSLLQVIQGPYFENKWRILQGTIWLDF